MKRLLSVAFGVAALSMTAFATTTAPASADVYVRLGPSYGGYSACRDYWYRRNHPYRCGYRYQREYYPYYRDYNYRDRDRCWNRWYRIHHPYRCRYYRRHDW